MPGQPSDGRRGADRASKCNGEVGGRVGRVATGSLSEARPVEAVATREVIPVVKGLVAHGVAGEGIRVRPKRCSSGTLATRLSTAI